MKLSGKTILFIFLALLSGFFCWQKSADAVETNHIIINEVMTGKSGAADWEFVELYNPTSSDIDLSGWTVKKKSSSGSETPLVSASRLQNKIIAAAGYLLLANEGGYSGSVVADVPWPHSYTLAYKNNAIVLYDNNNVVIDEADWIEIAEGYSWERTNAGSWQNSASAGGTPKAANSEGAQTPPLPPPADNSSSLPPVNPEPTTTTPLADQINVNYRLGDVVINEFVPDPADEQVEFVEIYNKRNENINLDGWFIYDGSGAQTILSGVIAGSGAKKYLVIEKPKGNLNNAGDLIILKQGDAVIDQVAYGDWKDGQIDDNAPTASDPKAIARTGDGYNTYNNKNDFAVSATITKGGANIISDADAASDAETRYAASLPQGNSSDIIINEILPQPRGEENEEEFIELFNRGDKEIDLTGWILGDSSTRRYAIKKTDAVNSGVARNDTIIKPQNYFVVYRRDSKIALNNSGDEVKLYPPDSETPAQTVKYEKSVEGRSYNVKNATSTPLTWEWSEVVTPGAPNIIQIKHAPVVDFGWSGEPVVGQIIFFDGSDTEDADGDDLTYLWNFGTGATSTEPNPIYIYFKAGNFSVSLTVSDGEHTIKEEKIIKIKAAPNASPVTVSTNATTAIKGVKIPGASAAKSSGSTGAKTNGALRQTTLENIRELAKGSYAKVEGTVAVKPGIFSTQYFYIVGSMGLQIYNNKKLFPALEVGDKISVAGELSESYGELRLKTKVASDIKKIATSTLPAPQDFTAEEIGEETEAQLVRVSGEVVDKKGSSIWLDDGNGEAEVYFKQGAKINRENINEGDKISVIGIVSQSNDKYRILPRSQQDIIMESGSAQTGEVLGAVSASDSWELAQNNKKLKLIQYLLVLSGGLIVVLAGVIWKRKK